MGRTGSETEAPVVAWCEELIYWKRHDTGKGWGQEKGMTEDERLDGIIDSMDVGLSKLGDSEGQGSLACCSPWGCIVRQDWVTEQQQNRFSTLFY